MGCLQPKRLGHRTETAGYRVRGLGWQDTTDGTLGDRLIQWADFVVRVWGWMVKVGEGHRVGVPLSIIDRTRQNQRVHNTVLV